MNSLAHLLKARKEVDSWYSAYKIAWLVAKAPEGINERSHEIPWILNHAKKISNKKFLLDVGSYMTSLPVELSKLGFQVTALDLRGPDPGSPKAIEFISGDIRKTAIPGESFDHVTCVSTLEHIGVKGRYGVKNSDFNGDIKALDEIHRILTPGGDLLVTIPVGALNVYPANRCYNRFRLKKIFRKFQVQKEEYYVHEKNNFWKKVSGEQADKINWYLCDWYALGCFKLIKPH